MILHMLPGDAIAAEFAATGLEGETAICRECLIEGPVNADNLHDFWVQREQYLAPRQSNSDHSYAIHVAAELGKLVELPSGSEVSLWFEYELFCQLNLWFCLYLLRDTRAEVYRVAPSIRAGVDIWKGFGCLSAEDLKECFSQRVKLRAADIETGSELWLAFKSGDHERLQDLAAAASDNAFPYLQMVCEAETAKTTRPVELLREIVGQGFTDFGEIFKEFSERAGVYGFGDAQVKQLLATL